jgi:lipopolysaccharide/colanic/teichoic acid biosynthesis glycosyltransferase
VKNDPRITPFGRFLRRFSLDELPQLWNVMRGEMSLIGSRPHLPEEIAQFTPEKKRILSIKPGLTGLAQVSGRSDLSFADEIRLDTYYLENWSFWLDLKIALKTVWVIIKGEGAD